MGLGNTNTYGNKKSNFRWQYAMLSALNKILIALGGGGSSAKTAALSRETTPGSTAAGISAVSFLNAGIADAIVAGAILKSGEAVSYDATGGPVNSIAYDATGTELVISTITV